MVEGKVILWGTGMNTRKLLKKYFIPMDVIEAVVDSDKGIQGSRFWGYQVQDPKIIKDTGKFQSKTVVIGTDRYYQEVLEQFREMNSDMEAVSIDDYITRFPAKEDNTTAGYYENEVIDGLIKRIEDAGEIAQEHLQNAKVLANRNEAIRRLPKGGKVAEVGVAYGDFSDILLKEMQPDHFYAIDWFNKDNPYICMWGRQELVESGMTHEEWYRNKYKKEIDSHKMTVCSGLSWECLAEFEDGFFDFIYLDACHDYECISKDAEIAVKKVKDGGIIQFNDYTIYDIFGRTHYGVVPVVNKVIAETGAEVLYYCMSSMGYCDVTIRINHSKSEI